MGEPRIADDFAFIAGRLKELEGERPSPGGKWGVWFTDGRVWCHLKEGSPVRQAKDGRSISLFASENEAKAAIAASADPYVRVHVMPKPYLETLT